MDIYMQGTLRPGHLHKMILSAYLTIANLCDSFKF